MNNTKLTLSLLIVILVAIIGYYVLNAPDRRNPVQKMGDAIHELHNGPDKAARQLENRTPGDKLKDAVTDEKHDVKKALNQQ